MMIEKIPDTVEAWEDGTLGCDHQHMKPAPPGTSRLVDDILGVTTIPVRLPDRVLATLAKHAKLNDTHLSALIWDILEDYATTNPIAASEDSL